MTEPQPLRVDDQRLWLPTEVEHRATYDVLLNEQHVWSVQPARDADGGSRRPFVMWPPALRRHLRGRAEVVLREHVSGAVLATASHVFNGEDDREVDVSDSNGNVLVLDKWGRLIRPLSGDAGDLIDELMDQCIALMAAILEKTGLPAFICYGTLLGAVRNGRLIGHDNDVDIAYASAADYPVDVVRESFRVQSALGDAGWFVRRGSGARLNVRLVLSDGSVRFIDIFSASWVEGVLYIPSDTGFRLPRETVLPLSTIELHGRQVPAPARPEELLEATYGERWRVPDPSFRYETPRWLARRLGGWYGGLAAGRKHWDAFAGKSKNLVPTEPTPFAEWVAANYGSQRTLVDLGAGTGRDSIWFATTQNRHVIAADYSPRPLRRSVRLNKVRARGIPLSVEVLNLYDLRAVLGFGARLSRLPEPVDIYARFTLHSLLQPVGRQNLIRLASMGLRRGGYLFLEFRTPKDRDRHHIFPGDRQFLPPRQVRRMIQRFGGTVVHQSQGTGLAPLREEDPHVCRMVATWSAQGREQGGPQLSLPT